jgi:plasmid stability protein
MAGCTCDVGLGTRGRQAAKRVKGEVPDSAENHSAELVAQPAYLRGIGRAAEEFGEIEKLFLPLVLFGPVLLDSHDFKYAPDRRAMARSTRDSLMYRTRRASLYTGSMSTTVQVRGVPDRVHRTLKDRAAREGMSLSDFIKRELQHFVQRVTVREWLDRTARLKPIPTRRTGAQLLRDLRQRAR